MAFAVKPLTARPMARRAVAARPAARRAGVVVAASAGGPYSWLRKDPLVLAIGFLGWTVPAASPSPSFGGGSLFGSLLAETSKGLAEFPTPPSIDSPFWIYLVTYHVGLFVCLTLAQIGVQGRKQGYF